MKRYSLSHLSDPVLARDLAAVVARERSTTAETLAHIAEFDARRLYLSAGYPSMFAYCVGELHLSEEAAFKRIHAARAARRFPAIFAAVAAGRLHLSAVVMLAPRLTEDTARELLAAATHKTKQEIEHLLAERYPRPDVQAWVQTIPSSSSDVTTTQHAPGRVAMPLVVSTAQSDLSDAEHAPRRVAMPPAVAAPVPAGCAADRPRVKTLAPERYAVQFTMSQSGHDQLRYAQELLSHRPGSGDIAQVFELALAALVAQLEKQKFAATSRPRTCPPRAVDSPRHIPAHVRRTVWARDAGQCTFIGHNGQRCQARKLLEYDHIQEIARGGDASVAGIRLRCRAHNQYPAECTFGAEFMRHKRLAAVEARVASRARVAEAAARPGT